MNGEIAAQAQKIDAKTGGFGATTGDAAANDEEVATGSLQNSAKAKDRAASPHQAAAIYR